MKSMEFTSLEQMLQAVKDVELFSSASAASILLAGGSRATFQGGGIRTYGKGRKSVYFNLTKGGQVSLAALRRQPADPADLQDAPSASLRLYAARTAGEAVKVLWGRTFEVHVKRVDFVVKEVVDGVYKTLLDREGNPVLRKGDLIYLEEVDEA